MMPLRLLPGFVACLSIVFLTGCPNHDDETTTTTTVVRNPTPKPKPTPDPALADQQLADATPPPPPLGTGRELFALFRHGADEAERGGSAMLAAMDALA